MLQRRHIARERSVMQRLQTFLALHRVRRASGEKQLDRLLMAEVGGDGFLLTTPVLRVSRKYLVEIADGLVPELQKRGLVRTEYKHQLLRDNLREF